MYLWNLKILASLSSLASLFVGHHDGNTEDTFPYHRAHVIINQDLDKEKNECKIVIIFLSISLSICFGSSKEPSHRDGSFEYPQNMF